MPTSAIEIGTAGPACSAAAWPVSTKMPAPMMAPMPSVIRLSGVSARFSWCSPASLASARRVAMDLVAHKLMRDSVQGGDETTVQTDPRFAGGSDLSIESRVRSICHIEPHRPGARHRQGPDVRDTPGLARLDDAIAAGLRVPAGVTGPGPQVATGQRDGEGSSSERGGDARSRRPRDRQLADLQEIGVLKVVGCRTDVRNRARLLGEGRVSINGGATPPRTASFIRELIEERLPGAVIKSQGRFECATERPGGSEHGSLGGIRRPGPDALRSDRDFRRRNDSIGVGVSKTLDLICPIAADRIPGNEELRVARGSEGDRRATELLQSIPVSPH